MNILGSWIKIFQIVNGSRMAVYLFEKKKIKKTNKKRTDLSSKPNSLTGKWSEMQLDKFPLSEYFPWNFWVGACVLHGAEMAITLGSHSPKFFPLLEDVRLTIYKGETY